MGQTRTLQETEQQNQKQFRTSKLKRNRLVSLSYAVGRTQL